MPQPSELLERARFALHTDDFPEAFPGELLVKLRDDAIRPFWNVFAPVARAPREPALRQVADFVAYLRRTYGLRAALPLSEIRGGRGDAGQVARRVATYLRRFRAAREEDDGLRGLSLLSLAAGVNERTLLRDVRGAAFVDYCERPPLRYLLGVPASPDPTTNLQWGLRAIRWFAAPMGSIAAATVAVVDSGVDEMHPDLNGAIRHYQRFGSTRRDALGHGSHVAGIIGAATNHGSGLSGMSDAPLHCWKVFPDPDRQGRVPAANGALYVRALAEIARDDAVRVVNLSIGGASHSITEERLVAALVARGKVVVAASGNEFLDGNPVEYPAAYPGVVAVGAVNELRRRAAFSCTGDHLALVAPGVNVLSTVPVRRSAVRDETTYAAWSGTSMAAPFVAGAAALLLGREPELAPTEVRRRLERSATRLAHQGRVRWNPQVGHGLLDLARLLS